MEKAAELGCGALCFEGNIDFYGKSGFKPASEYGIRYHGLPEGEDASFFLCKELVLGYLDGITGEYSTPTGYLVDEREAEAFDKLFPNKEKKELPGQIFRNISGSRNTFFTQFTFLRAVLLHSVNSFLEIYIVRFLESILWYAFVYA